MSDIQPYKRGTAAAREMLQRFEGDPTPTEENCLALFEWQGMLHIGRLIRPYPEKPYIAYVSKEREPLSRQTATAIRRMQPMPRLKVHPRVEFSGRNYLLGLTGDTLCVLSGEDILYCFVHRRHPQGEPVRTGSEATGFHPL